MIPPYKPQHDRQLSVGTVILNRPPTWRMMIGAVLLGCLLSGCLLTADTKATLAWRQTDGALSLMDQERTVWTFNYGQQHTKPFFHPLSLPGIKALTWKSPPDHPWHYGMWFSWKYINGVNYWEENRKTKKPAGITSWSKPTIETHDDATCRITMTVQYHLPGKPPVLTEQRVIETSAPAADGSYRIDWNQTFTAVTNVVLNRTPLPGEKGGKRWGGYAGLSVRLANAITDRNVSTSGDPAAWTGNELRTKATAMDYHGMFGGKRAGIAILDHPTSLNAPSPWYAIRSNVMSFFSPAVICYGPHTMKPGETFTLRYRIIIHPGYWNADRLATEQKSWGID